jgi:AcrR family transcriptional regulator
MFDTVLGLPVHPLVAHAVVVLVPLSALGVVAISVVPRWRERYGVLVLLLSTAALVMVPVATRSGERLEERIDAGGVVARQIADHKEIAELVLWPTLAMWVLAAVLVLLTRRKRAGTAVTLVAALAVVAALLAGAAVVRAGHLGSTAVWSCTIGSDACS